MHDTARQARHACSMWEEKRGNSFSLRQIDRYILYIRQEGRKEVRNTAARRMENSEEKKKKKKKSLALLYFTSLLFSVGRSVGRSSDVFVVDGFPPSFSYSYGTSSVRSIHSLHFHSPLRAIFLSFFLSFFLSSPCWLSCETCRRPSFPPWPWVHPSLLLPSFPPR